MTEKKETLFLTAFFKYHQKGSEYGFERIDLQHIWKTEEEARGHISFCDEAGWYEGVLIEERAYGWNLFKGKQIWMLQTPGGMLQEIQAPDWSKNCVNLIG